jgi:glycosyltransferase involved in cell wall biosynthesis
MLGFAKTGGYRVLSYFASFWQKAGNDVIFLIHQNSIDPYFKTTARVVRYDNKGNLLENHKNITYNNTKKINVLFLYLAMWKAIKKMNCSSNDVLLATQSITFYPVFFSRIKVNKSYYIQADEAEYYKFERGVKFLIWFLLARLTYSLPMKKIVNAKIYTNYKYIKTNFVINPGIDLNIFNTQARKTINPKIRIGAIGRIEAHKGTTYILDAFTKMQNDPTLEFHIAFGDNKWIKQIPKVKIFNPNSEEELALFYQTIDILIAVPIVQLGAFHFPVVEAMACGCSVITTGYEPADAFNSWLVPIKDSRAIIEAIYLIRSNVAESLAKKTKAHTDIKKYDWETNAMKMLSYMIC